MKWQNPIICGDGPKPTFARALAPSVIERFELLWFLHFSLYSGFLCVNLLLRV